MSFSPSSDLLLGSLEGPVLTLTLNRPQARNSLSRPLMKALLDRFHTIAQDRAIKVVILAAAGPVYCAGHDLKEMTAARAEADGGARFFRETFNECSALMQSILALPQPVIAQVHGLATAAGCQLAATCDLVVAARTARFATPGVNIGLFCSTPMVALSRAVGRKAAMEMLLTGDAVSADDAKALGLVNRVVDVADLEAETQALARRIAGKSRSVVAIGKRAFYDQVERPVADAYDRMAEVMTINMIGPDAAEGIGAFIEKRQPDWPEA